MSDSDSDSDVVSGPKGCNFPSNSPEVSANNSTQLGNAEFSFLKMDKKSPMYFLNTATHTNDKRLVLRNMPDCGELPLPPDNMMQYSETPEAHHKTGSRLAKIIREMLPSNGIELASLENVLEFGCSNCRVLRHFEDVARENNYWGCDINANTIFWNIENLSPPFNFFVNTTLPNLPIRDGYFDFVFATSVFTHMDDMFFGWLLEIKRVVAESGYAFLTFLNEGTIKFGMDRVQSPVGKAIASNAELIDDLLTKKNNMVVINRDSSSMTFVRGEFIEKHLSQLFEVVSVVENTMAGHQTGYLLKNTKP
ncbi:MAG: class I SAM-dependent methyltransferase [Mariniblastus sp.]